jgi:hypothetical protein
MAQDRQITITTVDVGSTPGEIAANTTEESDYTIAGVGTGDFVALMKPTHQAGLGIVGVRVKSANTIAITFMNNTGGGITPTDEDLAVLIIKDLT